MQNNYFLEMIKTLRQSEELILHVNIYEITTEESIAVVDFLEKEYKQEAKDYPNQVPEFDKEAALFAAELLYHTAQLILYREQRPEDIEQYFLTYTNDITPSSMLSADLCLRFIPHLLNEIKFINAEDELIPLIETNMKHWPYSAINIDFQKEIEYNLPANECLHNLFINRVIQFKNRKIAQQELFSQTVRSQLGNYGETFWSELYITESNE